MKGTKDVRTNKGITLIALVITIIVMLILVAVTITMAVNGGLFEYAGRAGTETNTKRDDEQEFANLESGMTYDELINKYTEWTEDGDQGGTGNKGESGGDTPEEPNNPEVGDDDTPILVRCEKCTNGQIEGYKCLNTDCGKISTTIESVMPEGWDTSPVPVEPVAKFVACGCVFGWDRELEIEDAYGVHDCPDCVDGFMTE